MKGLLESLGRGRLSRRNGELWKGKLGHLFRAVCKDTRDVGNSRTRAEIRPELLEPHEALTGASQHPPFG